MSNVSFATAVIFFTSGSAKKLLDAIGRQTYFHHDIIAHNDAGLQLDVVYRPLENHFEAKTTLGLAL